ncbi:MAG: mucoidy inhibitor MuiA family protein [Myxococcota bacterium]
MSALILAVLASTAAPDRVVVFPDRAQVTRVTQVTCGARVPVTFEGIPPAAAQDSFRARLTGGTVDGLRAELVSREKEFGPKAEALTKQLDELTVERQTLNDDLARARSQQQAGSRYGDIAAQLVSREMVSEGANVKAWQTAFDASLAAGLASAKSQADLGAKLKDLSRREEEVRLQLEQVRVSAQKRSWTVEVLASCPQGRQASLELVYLVGGASWTPVYDARALEGAVDFSTWATLTQATGEDWNQVDLVLSTAVPSQNATPPELMKLKVSAYERPPEKKVLVRRDEYVERAQSGKDKDTGGEAYTGLAARSQGLSVQLALPEKAKVPGDGSPVRLFVGKTKMKATFELRAMPRLHPVAFRVAELTNQAPWPLLPGRVDAFRATGLVGRYRLDRVAQGAAFTLTFGLEDSVRVKRVTLEELKRDAGLFNNKKRFTYAYRFEVANYGKAPVEVSLAESVPVSELEDISVAVTEKTTPGYALGKDDGIAKWKVPLRPGERKNVELSFKVEVPSSYETGGL